MLTQWDAIVTQWMSGLGMPLEGILRLVLAAVCGGLVGLEREIRGREAGFRTNLLVAFGSALVMVVSTSFASGDWSHARAQGITINVDPARIAYGVMTGIGFLGAGTIVHAKGSVRGLTTAAALWCVAAIGLAAGFGLYVITAAATLLVLLSLFVLDFLEDGIPKLRYRTVTVRRKFEAGCIADTVNFFKSRKLDVIDASFERCDDKADFADISLRIAFVSRRQYYSVERELEGDTRYELRATREL